MSDEMTLGTQIVLNFRIKTQELDLREKTEEQVEERPSTWSGKEKRIRPGNPGLKLTMKTVFYEHGQMRIVISWVKG